MNYEYNFQMMDETDCESVWHGDYDIFWSYWGFALFEGEYPEITIICMLCGHHHLTDCICPPEKTSQQGQEEPDDPFQARLTLHTLPDKEQVRYLDQEQYVSE